MGRVSLCEIHPAAYKKPASGGNRWVCYVTTDDLEITRVFVVQKEYKAATNKNTNKLLLFAATRWGAECGWKGSGEPKQKKTKVRIPQGNRQGLVRQIRFSAPSAGCHHGAYCDCRAPSGVSRARSREGGRIAQWRSDHHCHRRWIWAGVR